MKSNHRPRCASALLPAALLACACTADQQYVATAPPVLPVRSIVLEYGPFQGELTLLGVVRPAESLPLTTPGGGIVSYPPRFAQGLRTGERVTAGETVAVLDSSSARLAVTEALLQAESDGAELRRAQAGFEAGLISRAELDRRERLAALSGERLKSAREESDRLTLVAPRAGRLIVDQSYPPEMQVAPGTTLATIAVDGSPRVEAWAAASNHSVLRTGLSTTFRAAGEDRLAGRGAVREVSPVVNDAGLVRVILGVTESDALPAPGEGVEVRVELGKRAEVLSVPLEALTNWSGGHAVFVLEPAGAAYETRRVVVQLGERNGVRVEVTGGLNRGDRIAVAGVSQLTEGARVSEVAEPGAAR